jgi:hypothetical protein
MRHSKHCLVLVLMLLVLAGCAHKEECYGMKNYMLNQQMEASVGNPIIYKEIRCTGAGALPPQISSIELLYSGIANNILKISYREYSNNMARQAFYQDVQYDLKESNIIVFRNTRIQIINASNNKISYKVLESPDSTQSATGTPISGWVVKPK